jgi:hypothetical protein
VSVLGSLLFCLYISDCPVNFPDGNILFYADDVKLYRKISNPNDYVLLQNDIDNLSAYCAAWGLAMNPKKIIRSHILPQGIPKHPSILCRYRTYSSN